MRFSNIELCRFLSIVMIVILHTGFQTFGVPTDIEETSFVRLVTQACCNAGVDVFILITGFFSAKIKTRSIINLSFICFFYAIAYAIVLLMSDNDIPLFNIFNILFISRSNWFIPCYLCLLAFAPFLNKASETMSQKELLYGIIVIISLVTWFGYFPAMPVLSIGTNHGCSVVSFMVVYLIGRYIRLYDLPKSFSKLSLPCFFLSSMFIGSTAYLALKYGGSFSPAIPKHFSIIYDNNNPLMIFSAVSFFVFFKNLQIESKFINYLAKSTLAVLLFHYTPYFPKHFQRIFADYDGLMCACLWIGSVFAIVAGCVMVDQIRILLYKPIDKLTKRT